MQKLIIFFVVMLFFFPSIAQPTHFVTDKEKKYKEVKEHITKEEYAFAYTAVKELKTMYPENMASNHNYINEDVDFFYVLCGLKLMQEPAKNEAINYIASVTNEPRRQLISFHLAHYYFLNDDYLNAVEYFSRSGYDNLSNEQIADAKFEKAYSLFNLKRFAEAKPLFNEIQQVQENKYYIPANYYYGFISYYDKDFTEALRAFKLVEIYEEYKGVVPYYITEIYYFQGNKDEALSYGQAVLQKYPNIYYADRLRLLMGQAYFEKKDFANALPLLENYVNNNDKVSKEVLYELSYCYYVQNQTQKAIEGFKQLSNEKDSMGQNSMYLLGGLYLKTGNKNAARNAFQFCAYNSSNAAQQQVSRFNYAKLSYELGYQDVALKEIKTYLQDYPNAANNNEARELLVLLLTNTSNFSEALQLYETFNSPTLAMQKAYPKILFGRAMEFINDQQINKADDLLSKIIANQYAGSILPYAQFWKGEIAYRQQNFDAAIRYFNAFIPTNSPTLGEASLTTAKYNLGYAWMHKQDYKQALAFFEQVTKTVNSNSSTVIQDSYLRSADCNYMLKNYQQANAMYTQITLLALPQSDYALYQRAMIAGIKSSNEKIKLMNSLQNQYPGSSLAQDANLEIALTYITDEKFGEAIPYLDKILVSSNEGMKPKALAKKALAYYNANNNKQALSSYKELIQKYPQSAEANDALINIKDIYVEEGNPNEYLQLMKENGKIVSATEADELTYNAALLKYNTGNCDAAIPALNSYINTYANGVHIIEMYFLRSECYRNQKKNHEALAGYEFINSKGLNKYYEKATLQAAQINYFELKDFTKAKKYFTDLKNNATSQDNLLEALRGLVRSHYLLKDYAEANVIAKELVSKKGISTDDKSIGYLLLGKAQQRSGDCAAAIASFKSVAVINKSAWGAEARYESAQCQFLLNNLPAAEKAAMSVIKETGSYDLWVTKAYLLLGDIFMLQKDYFNAKATFESVAKNAAIPELKKEAEQKFDAAVAAEKKQSKIAD
ncbi:MAG TPA: tetratricopeptide repeat protein [Ferruginibacter sp.]|nr:tetratricopeptide repeat protein [Ferruginibacter sp.]